MAFNFFLALPCGCKNKKTAEIIAVDNMEIQLEFQISPCNIGLIVVAKLKTKSLNNHESSSKVDRQYGDVRVTN